MRLRFHRWRQPCRLEGQRWPRPRQPLSMSPIKLTSPRVRRRRISGSYHAIHLLSATTFATNHKVFEQTIMKYGIVWATARGSLKGDPAISSTISLGSYCHNSNYSANCVNTLRRTVLSMTDPQVDDQIISTAA